MKWKANGWIHDALQVQYYFKFKEESAEDKVGYHLVILGIYFM